MTTETRIQSMRALDATLAWVTTAMARVGLRASLLPGYVIGVLVLYYSWQEAGSIVPKWNDALTRAVCLLGGVLGWIAGIVSLPETPWQATQFNRGWAALSTFVGGAFFAKVMGSLGDIGNLQTNHLARLALWTIWFAVGLLFTAAPRIGEIGQTAEPVKTTTEKGSGG